MSIMFWMALFIWFISTLSHSISFRVSPRSFTRQSCCTLLSSASLPWRCCKDDSTLPDMCESLWSDPKQNTIISAFRTILLCLRLCDRSQVQCVWMPWSNFNGMQKKCHFWRTCGLPCVSGVFPPSHVNYETDMSSKLVTCRCPQLRYVGTCIGSYLPDLKSHVRLSSYSVVCLYWKIFSSSIFETWRGFP